MDATGGPMSDPPIDPARYAALVRETPDEQLERGLASHRDFILGEIFKAMPDRLEPDVSGPEVVAEWRITERPDGGQDRWQVVVSDGDCEVVPDGARTPEVVLTIAPLDFVKLTTGAVKGPELFMTGRLQIDGDLLAAARMDGMFRRPGGDGEAGEQ